MRAPVVFLAFVLVAIAVLSTPLRAADPPDAAALKAASVSETPPLSKKWSVLFTTGRGSPGVRQIPPGWPLKVLEDFEFTGPAPGHPFVLGAFAADGVFGIAEGCVQPVSGRNAVLKLARAEDFELEGTLEMGDEGGWFLLLGWNEGLGYSIINVGFRQSPSPWFITEYRGGVAIPDAHQEVAKHAWQRDQPFKLAVNDQQLNLEVGKVKVLREQRLANYAAGDVILGVYDTKYGPRPVKIRALRIRAVD